MPLSNATKIKLRSVFVITLIWMVVSMIIVLHDYLFQSELKIMGIEAYDPSSTFFTTIFAVSIAGFIAAPLMVFYLKDRFKNKPLWFSLFFNTATFVVIITIVTLPASIFYNLLSKELSIGDSQLAEEVWKFYTSPSYLLILFNWTLISFLTLIVLQVNDKYGQGVMFALLKGKYNKPKQEERIFMFLDITSSTTIAEELGNIQYFELLRSFFQDITQPILKNYGEIYQYVGDEIVVSWKMKNGLRRAHCLQCFFEIENTMQKLSPKYIRKYGLVPGYKAGLHCGEVTVGEVGTIKKDIIFSGDVLNTTARIQDACKRFDAKLLISQDLIHRLDTHHSFGFKEIGAIQLRGKLQPVNLSIVHKKTLPDDAAVHKHLSNKEMV
ncbi:adenylate/guanylate cyclase domain-containing protein [Fulvivirgaceae bacterium BMA12]|uniref:Adenylate/guanylate cyclase domain-containing protein n=1 Tax=Agaribacillus aureus TaxID=3051825 RepID=A0ABT8LG43_9BACT|nr:adenylate/guanylate cyclase domain-containing protein [Fulvivirgaceae bacterium BMA12]